jgi:hypothetical protein
MDTTTESASSRATLDRMDEAWAAFRERVHEVPTERLDLHIGNGWTRKQMLAHITAWHDRTVEAIGLLAEGGEVPGDTEDTDVINARAARASLGRTAGEVLAGMEESYRQVRRAVSRLTDAQLAANEAWLTAMIAGNTYGHYTEHLADLSG